MSSAAFLPDLDIGHSMFDWPLQIQTSPKWTSLMVTVFLPLIVNSKGPPAFCAGMRNIHLPSLPGLVPSFDWTVESLSLSPHCTVSPSLEVPHTGHSMPCCSTIPSVNSECGVISARAEVAANA